MCPDSPSGCAMESCQNGECTGPLSEFDADGCPRPRCEVDPCPAGRTCVTLGDWGACAPSTTVCEVNGMACTCGGTLDCSGSVSICVPDDEAPPPVEECVAQDPGVGFSFSPAIGEDQGQSTCTVENTDPLQFDCSGDFTGTYTLDLYASSQHDLSAEDTVTIDYWFEDQGAWNNEWLRITRDFFPFEPVVAVSADSLFPPGVNESDFLPTNVDIAAAETECPPVSCADTATEATGQAIRTGNEFDFIDFPPGAGGIVAGKFGGETVVIQVREARLGSCDAALVDQASWYAFTLLQQPG